MADVWLAEDQELGRRVAVKILHERYANDEQFVERFRREATHAAGPLPPQHRLDLRPGRRRGLVLHRDGVHRGPDAEGADRHSRAVPRAGRDLLHAPDSRRASLRAQERDHPQGHQAAQRDRRPRGPRQGRRLRHRPRRRERDDRSRLDRRDGAVPLARAGPRRTGRRELGPLFDGDRPLRAADGDGAVHRRDTGRDRDEAPFADAGGAVGTESRDPPRPRPRRASRTREGAGRPLPVGSRPRSRSRARRARRPGRHGDRDGRDDGIGGCGGDRRHRRHTRHGPPHPCRPEGRTAARSATGRTTGPFHNGEASGRGCWPPRP